METQEKFWDEEYKRVPNLWKMDTYPLPNILKNKSVLELGVGNGKTLRAIMRQNPKSVSAIDFSQEAINSSKALFQDKKIQFIKCDVKKLPFKDGEFDVIVCYYILNNLLENERILAMYEISRVLRKGGKVFFEDFGIGDFRDSEDKEEIEPHTVRKKNGLLCHFFDTKEVRVLFEDFKQKTFQTKSTFPIHKKTQLERRILYGMAVK